MAVRWSFSGSWFGGMQAKVMLLCVLLVAAVRVMVPEWLDRVARHQLQYPAAVIVDLGALDPATTSVEVSTSDDFTGTTPADLAIRVQAHGSGEVPVFVPEPFGTNLSTCTANNSVAVTIRHHLSWDHVPPAGRVWDGNNTSKIEYTEVSVPAKSADDDGWRVVSCVRSPSSLWRSVHDGRELSLPQVTSVTDAKAVEDCPSVPTSVSAVVTVDDLATFEHATLERHASSGSPLPYDEYSVSATEQREFGAGTCARSTPFASVVYDTEADAQRRRVRDFLVGLLGAAILGVIGAIVSQLTVARRRGRHSEDG